MKHIFQQCIFILRFRYLTNTGRTCRKFLYLLAGMKIGRGTLIPNIYATWPHQIDLGEKCVLEHNIFFKYDGIWAPGPSIIIGDNGFIGNGCEFNIRKSIVIGKYALIASGCKFIDHDHGFAFGRLIRQQAGVEAGITLGDDVWLGCNVTVLKGVEIGSGAIIAAGSVVTKSIPKNEIWAGIPAKKLSERT